MCGACCKYIIFPYSPALVEITLLRNGGVIDFEGKKYFYFYAPCSKLRDNLCSIHDVKPKFCMGGEAGDFQCRIAKAIDMLFKS